MDAFNELVGFFRGLSIISGTLLTIASIFVTIGFKRWGWPYVQRFLNGVGGFFKGIAALSELPGHMPDIQRIASVDAKLQSILKEVSPNGGSSLRDAVTSTRDTAKRTEMALAVFINSTRAQWDGMGLFAVFEASPTGEFTYVNSTYMKWTNKSERDLIGAGWINAIDVDDRRYVREEWESCVSDIREFTKEYTMLRVDGAPFGVICTATPVTEYSNGPVAKWVGVIRKVDVIRHDK